MPRCGVGASLQFLCRQRPARQKRRHVRRINGHSARVTTLASLGAFVLMVGVGELAGASSLQIAQTAQTVTAGDPAAERLRWVTYGFLGLAALLFAATVVYWFATRPDPVGERAAAPSEADAASEVLVAESAAPNPVVESAAVDSVEEAAAEDVSSPEPADPTPAEPVVRAVAGTFDSDDVVVASTPSEIDLTDDPVEDPGGDEVLVLSPLTAALAAIPDMEPTVVRFDDPPVQRVRRPLPPPGAPNFDRMARENTARHQAVQSARRVEQRPRRTQRTIDPDQVRGGESTVSRRSRRAIADAAASAPSSSSSSSTSTSTTSTLSSGDRVAESATPSDPVETPRSTVRRYRGDEA